MSDQRAALLTVAIAFSTLRTGTPETRLLHGWLDTWQGLGAVAVGMHRQGYDLQLTEYDARGWRATFSASGIEHSPTSATGTGKERTPWLAVQRAAWEAPPGDVAGSSLTLRRPISCNSTRVIRGLPCLRASTAVG
jgi:hypothetical protein